MIASKSNYNFDDIYSEDEDEDDEDMALLVKKFCKMARK